MSGQPSFVCPSYWRSLGYHSLPRWLSKRGEQFESDPFGNTVGSCLDYPLVIERVENYQCVEDLAIENGGFPQLCKRQTSIFSGMSTA